MDYGLTTIVAPTEEPITLEEAKANLRIRPDLHEEDAKVERAISAAREDAEIVTRRALVTRTLEMTLDRFPVADCDRNPFAEIRVPRPPLLSIVSLKYVDTGGVERTLVEGTDFEVDKDTEPGRVSPAYGRSWPVARWQRKSVKVRFTAGYGAAAAVPPWAKELVHLLTTEHYEDRKPVVVGSSIVNLPAADRLIWGHRVLQPVEG